MSRDEHLPEEERKRCDKQTAALQHWETELRALAQQLEDADDQNGWVVRYRHLGEPKQLTAVVTIDGTEFARFSRDQTGITGAFGCGEAVRYADRYTAFNAAVKRRIARQRMAGGR